MSEIKKGDLVLIVGCDPAATKYCQAHIGKVVTVFGPATRCSDPDCWEVEPMTMHGRYEVVWGSCHLKKLDPDALRDDTEQQEPLKRDARLTVSLDR